jgi:peptide/nickel transport system substrate-binding protein
MSQTPKRWSVKGAVFAASLAVVFAACSGATTSSTPGAQASTPASVAPPASAAASGGAFTGMVYPATGEAPCGSKDYPGILKKMTAVDSLTVEFQLCAPDVAFLPKIAFASFGIQDADWLAKHAADKSYLTTENGTGPYVLKSWEKKNRLNFEAFDGYWGTKALTPKFELRWADTAAQRLLELKAGTIDGMDNPGIDEIAQIKADSTLAFYGRDPMNVSYLGFNRTKAPWTDENVRKAIAMGIDRDQIVKNFYPEGSLVANKFTPCPPLVPFGCEGDDWYTFDPTAAKQLLQQANFDFTKEYPLSFRAAVRPYSPDPPAIATEIKAQLEKNLGIKVKIDLQDSAIFRANFTAGKYDGIAMYGWGADYPDTTNFLDFHFGAGSGPKLGGAFDDIAAALTKGATSASDADRQAAYKEANNLIKQHVPVVPMIHGANGTAFLANVEGANASPLTTEIFSVMKAADDTLTFMQSAEPISVYCGDESDGESLRACEQTTESLYAYKIGGTDPVPSLATECTSNADKTVWTCKLRDGVKFHDGATFDANDVITTFAAMWDASNPLHVGNDGSFEYFHSLWGLLNPKPAAPAASPAGSPAASPSAS